MRPTPPMSGSQLSKPDQCNPISEVSAPGAISAPGLTVPSTNPTPPITDCATVSNDVSGSKPTKSAYWYWKLISTPASPASAPEIANATTLVRNTPTPDAAA